MVELKTFLVRGPVIIIVYGECYILGVKIINQKIIWNNNKTLPIEKRDSTKIRLIGNKHQLKGPFSKKINSNLGMSIWKELSDDILNQKYKTIVVVGPSDSGKSTFSLYLANRFINSGQRPLLLDADVGQGDLAPPTCIGSAVLKHQSIDLSKIKADYVSFIGSIQPTDNENRIIRCVSKLVNKASSYDRCIINTDGYVNGKGLDYKLKLLNKIQPECVVCLGNSDIQSKVGQNTRIPERWKFIIRYGPSPNSVIRRSQLDRFQKRMNTLAKFFNQNNTELVQIHLKDIRSIYYQNRFQRINYSSSNNSDISRIRSIFLKLPTNNKMQNVFTGLGSVRERDILNGFGLVKNFENDILTILSTCQKFDSIYLSELQLGCSI